MDRIPAARFTVLTVAAVVALVGALVFGRHGPRSCDQPTPSSPAGVEVVPDVVGCSKAQGERLVRERGLRFKVEPEGTQWNDDGLIVGQRPSARQVVPEGTEIVLRERCLPAPCPSPAPGLEIYDPCTCAAR